MMYLGDSGGVLSLFVVVVLNWCFAAAEVARVADPELDPNEQALLRESEP